MLVRKQQQFWYSLHIIIIVLLFVSIMYLLHSYYLLTCLLCDSNKKLRYYKKMAMPCKLQKIENSDAKT